jgi:octaprenyl-diphosphate synthase
MTGSALPRTDAPAAIPAVLAPLNDELDLVGEKFAEILSQAADQSRDMVRHAARFNGKRLRPALTCLAARIAGRGVTGDVATVAAVVELIHTATLVHDDILDGAETRRKVATLNTRWGNHSAVLVGDVLFSKAYCAAAWLDDPFASRYLSDVVAEVLEGEIHQNQVAHDPGVSEDEYRSIIRGKTAALYEAALVAGAHYGGADETLKKRLGAYGHHLGMAFQIVDDRLDLSGDEETVGKSLGTDLIEGKMTLPVILWLRDRPPSEQASARAQVETAWKDAEQAAALAVELRASGALARADEAARAEVELALTCLAEVPESADRTLLETLAGFVVSRTN